MCDNEYLAHYIVRERLREAEARSALRSMLRDKRAGDTSREEAGPTRLELWWHASAAWVAHLALPKMWNRL
jgi:hypothetical protein